MIRVIQLGIREFGNSGNDERDRIINDKNSELHLKTTKIQCLLYSSKIN
jgi:hypothetical protein